MIKNNIVTIKKPKSNIIGIIPFNKKTIDNENVELNMDHFLLKKGKYFVCFEKNQDPLKKQIKDFVLNEYSSEIDDNQINYFGKKGNVLVFIINIDNLNKINGGSLSDYSNNNIYSWKRFYYINFNKDNKKNKDYNIHLSNAILSERKKQKIYLDEIYNFTNEFKV